MRNTYSFMISNDRRRMWKMLWPSSGISTCLGHVIMPSQALPPPHGRPQRYNKVKISVVALHDSHLILVACREMIETFLSSMCVSTKETGIRTMDPSILLSLHHTFLSYSSHEHDLSLTDEPLRRRRHKYHFIDIFTVSGDKLALPPSFAKMYTCEVCCC